MGCKQISFFVFTFLIFFGCSQKEYFKPLEINGEISFSSKLPSEIVNTNINAAILKNRQILTQEGLSTFEYKEDENFVGYSEGVYLFNSHCQELLIYDQRGGIQEKLPINFCPVSATIKGDEVAIVGNENTIHLYNLKSKKEIFTKKTNSAIAVNSLIQNPVFSNGKIYYPMLDGSVVIMDKTSGEIDKTIVIDSAPFFNNVIFLDVSKDLTLMATAKKLLSLYGGSDYTYDAEIRDIKINADRIYLSTLDGRIKELDFTLKLLRELKFQFANFSTINITDNTLSVLEIGSGYLIKIDLKTFTPLIYKISLSREKNIFTRENLFYYEKEILELK